jgi:hypothetical protein
MSEGKQGSKGEAERKDIHDPKWSSVSYSALISNASHPVQPPTTLLIGVTRTTRMTDAVRDVGDTARFVAQRFASWLNDPLRRHAFFDVFEGQRSNLSVEERFQRLVRLAEELAGNVTVQTAEGFTNPNYMTASELKDDPGTMTELPSGCIAALLAVRRAPSLIMLSSSLGLSQTVNLGVHLHAAAIAYHSVYLGLAIDPGAVTEKLAQAAGAHRIASQWAFVQVRLNGVPTYAIGLK